MLEAERACPVPEERFGGRRAPGIPTGCPVLRVTRWCGLVDDCGGWSVADRCSESDLAEAEGGTMPGIGIAFMFGLSGALGLGDE